MISDSNLCLYPVSELVHPASFLFAPLFIKCVLKLCGCHLLLNMLLKSWSGFSSGRDGSGAGAVDEEDFIQAFEDVPTVQVWIPFYPIRITEVASSHPPSLLHQIYSNREVEEAMTKIRDVLSDDKRDWELRVAAVSRPHLFRINRVKTTLLTFFSSLSSSSWKRCARFFWPAQQSSMGSCSSCASWRRRSNCPPRTSALRWSGRPASLWGETHGSTSDTMQSKVATSQ